ncbi:inositol-pentakisphosphate 2-kinase-like [Schistocerca piceifrons]|uniref:inositol-pentakisphosphate 2-kinase-like n=1 Tax=Schistocerca piceifrons TaxID=274613 RepID=UPI001F5FCE82|nr:inositol-pentakisphosphate 2-kinase-like [Schistocerca piceifrons]
MEMEDLEKKSWHYLGEGNANIVIAIPEDFKVLRFRKSNNLTDQQLLLEYLYTKHIIEPMLRGFVQVPVVIYMKGEHIVKLQEAMKKCRPVHRQNKSISSNFVMMFNDYTKLPPEIVYKKQNPLPVFCVELKPKQGWLHPDDRYLPKCKYCANQYLKVMENSVRCQSRYCPYDLFSGNYTRMKKAIHNLLSTPQNNLRIFKNGVLVYGDGRSSNDLSSVLLQWFSASLDKSTNRLVHKFCDIIIRALTHVKKNSAPEIKDATILLDSQYPLHLPKSLVETAAKNFSENKCTFAEGQLPKHCVLDLIIRGQQQQTRGASWIYHTYKKYESFKDYEYIPMVLKKSVNSDLLEIHRYLLAATFKDCSVMLTFQQATESPCGMHLEQIVTDDEGMLYAFDVHVTDLDPKPWSCIEKHRKRDLRILQACKT